jgi:hypothetical protein
MTGRSHIVLVSRGYILVMCTPPGQVSHHAALGRILFGNLTRNSWAKGHQVAHGAVDGPIPNLILNDVEVREEH